MLKLTLEAIELVDAIARHGSFAAAAERLYKVPSTISYAVAKLEEQLGLALFVRNGPRVTLTPAGHEMLKEGRWLLAAARQLESRMRQIATGFETELRFAHDSLIPTYAFGEDIRAFEALDTGTRLRIHSDALNGPWEALREGRADIVVAAGEARQAAATRPCPWAASSSCSAWRCRTHWLGWSAPSRGPICWSTPPWWWATAPAH